MPEISRGRTVLDFHRMKRRCMLPTATDRIPCGVPFLFWTTGIWDTSIFFDSSKDDRIPEWRRRWPERSMCTETCLRLVRAEYWSCHHRETARPDRHRRKNRERRLGQRRQYAVSDVRHVSMSNRHENKRGRVLEKPEAMSERTGRSPECSGSDCDSRLAIV